MKNSSDRNRYVKRIISKKILNLFENFPIVVVVGARQVGKSTLLKHLFPNFSYVLFDPAIDVENARKDPELFLKNRKIPLILDEVQYAPELISLLKRKIDEDQSSGQYLLTGSQQWGVLKNVSESLAGRAVFVDLEGFSLLEIANIEEESSWLERWLENPDDFIKFKHNKIDLPNTLFEHLWIGGMPKVQFLKFENIQNFHSAYQRTYIERDIRLLANISDLQLFGRFVRLVAAFTAKEINYQELGREIGLSAKTAKRWLNLLKETFQWYEYPPYRGNVIKRISSKPKGYFADTGQVCFSQSIATPTSLGSHPFLGSIFETAVVNEIRKQCSWMNMPPNIYHWKMHSGAEVDLILERDGKYFPMEIKVKSRPNKFDTLGIKAFRNSYPNLKIEKGLIIAPCEEFMQISDNDYQLPWNSL